MMAFYFMLCVYPQESIIFINLIFLFFFSSRSRTKTVHDRVSLAGLNQLPTVPQIAKVSKQQQQQQQNSH